MVGNRTVYWVAQFAGWLLYVMILLVFNLILGREIDEVLIQSVTLWVLVGVSVSHFNRFIIIKFNWLNLPILKAVAVIVTNAIVLGIICHVIHSFLSALIIDHLVESFNQSLSYNVELAFNWSLIIFFWTVLYFFSHYFVNYKKEEIKNLKMLASQNEIELTNLKSQLNPHFMFNALNSIRALVDEDPAQAKNAITQLSAMLRGALQTGKRQLISLDEELNLVKSYLAIETIRFEERLTVKFNIAEESLSYNIPPLMIQTLVENAVKHGISSLTEGGVVEIKTELKEGQLLISVKNSGKYSPGGSGSTGIGLKNTRRRLGLLYGKEGEINISTENQEVTTTILIPKNLIYENIDN